MLHARFFLEKIEPFKKTNHHMSTKPLLVTLAHKTDIPSAVKAHWVITLL